MRRLFLFAGIFAALLPLSAQETPPWKIAAEKLSAAGAPALSAAQPILNSPMPLGGTDPTFSTQGLPGWLIASPAGAQTALLVSGHRLLFSQSPDPKSWSGGAELIAVGSTPEPISASDLATRLIQEQKRVPLCDAPAWLMAAALLALSGDEANAEAIWTRAQNGLESAEAVNVAVDRWLRWKLIRTLQSWKNGAEQPQILAELRSLESLWPAGQRGQLALREAVKRIERAGKESDPAPSSAWVRLMGDPQSQVRDLWTLRSVTASAALARLWAGQDSWFDPEFRFTPPLALTDGPLPWLEAAPSESQVPGIDALTSFLESPSAAVDDLSEALASEQITRFLGATGYFPQFETEEPTWGQPPGFGSLPMTSGETALACLGVLIPGFETLSADLRPQTLAEWRATWFDKDSPKIRTAYLAHPSHADAAAFLMRQSSLPEEKAALRAWLARAPGERLPWLTGALAHTDSPEERAELISSLGQPTELSWMIRALGNWFSNDAVNPEPLPAEIPEFVDGFVQGTVSRERFQATLSRLILRGEADFSPRPDTFSTLVRAASRTDDASRRALLLLRSFPPLLPNRLTYAGEGGVSPGLELKTLLADTRAVDLADMPGATIAGLTALLTHISAGEASDAARILTFQDPAGWDELLRRANLWLGLAPEALSPAPDASPADWADSWMKATPKDRSVMLDKMPVGERADFLAALPDEVWSAGDLPGAMTIRRIRTHSAYEDAIAPLTPWLNKALTRETCAAFETAVRKTLAAHPDATFALASLAPGRGLLLTLTPADQTVAPLPELAFGLAAVPENRAEADLLVALGSSRIEAVADPESVRFWRLSADGRDQEGLSAARSWETVWEEISRDFGPKQGFWLAITPIRNAPAPHPDPELPLPRAAEKATAE